MKIMLPLKRVPDYQIKVKPHPNGKSIDTAGLKWIVNPFDEIAVEEAIRLKEGGKASELVLVAVGSQDTALQLRQGLALGADRAILVEHSDGIDSRTAARLLSEIYKKEGFDLIILGKQAIDSDANQTGQILSTLLSLPIACFASKIEISGSAIKVIREIDGGLETIEFKGQGIITCDLRLNEPRYASLPNIMKAKSKPIDIVKASDLIPNLESSLEIKNLRFPPKRSAGRKVDNVDELIAALKNEAKVL
jgi:electron transfer flavoprotein beta subunit